MSIYKEEYCVNHVDDQSSDGGETTTYLTKRLSMHDIYIYSDIKRKKEKEKEKKK